MQLSSYGFSPFYSISPSRNKFPKFPQTLTLEMITQSGSTKRPTCPFCSKPTRVCFCSRLKPPLNNSVAVTILQHSLEKTHPLNSAKIATLGLKNVDVITVSDVNFQARFFIRLVGGLGRVTLNETCHLFDEMQSEVQNHEFIEIRNFDAAKLYGFCKDETLLQNTNFPMNGCMKSDLDSHGGELALRTHTFDEAMSGTEIDSQNVAIDFTIEKYGSMNTILNLDDLLASNLAFDYIRTGFHVKKIQRKPLEGIKEHEESEEFNITIPPGSVLLFPSEKSVGIESVKFEVKNLIVLDGTWSKAKRMYNENPWLKLLPHIGLDVDKPSLYSEVRQQPRAGYLSTIESIVYALKAVGKESERFDRLLNVFESMVGDQRRCKDERLSKVSEFRGSDS